MSGPIGGSLGGSPPLGEPLAAAPSPLPLPPAHARPSALAAADVAVGAPEGVRHARAALLGKIAACAAELDSGSGDSTVDVQRSTSLAACIAECGASVALEKSAKRRALTGRAAADNDACGVLLLCTQRER
jgi:hypothetical protein